MIDFKSNDIRTKYLSKMKDSLINLSKMIFSHYIVNNFSPTHHKLSDMLINSIKNKINLLIILPRGFAKSTFSLLFFIIWVLIFSEKKYIILIGEGKDAIFRHFSDKLVYELEHNKFIKVLGIKKGGIWKVSKDDATIELICPSIKFGRRRVRIEARSYGQSLRGSSVGEARPDLILIDDLERQKTKTAAGVESEVYRRDVARWFFSEIIPIGGAPGEMQIIMMGTIMHEDQLLVRLFNKPLKGSSKFETVKYGYLIDDGKGGLKSLWKDRFSVDELLAKKEMYYEQGLGNNFANEWLSEIQDSRNQVFMSKDFKYYYKDGKYIVVYKSGCKTDYSTNDFVPEFERKIHIDDLLIYILVDPAVSEDDINCDSSIAVIGVSSRREWFLLDISYGKWRGSKLWEEIFSMNKKYKKALTTGIEGVGYQKAIPDALKNMMRTRKTYFKVELIKNNGQNKFTRIISALEWRYVRGLMFHDLNANYTKVYEDQLKKVSVDGTKGLIDLVDSVSLGGDIIKGAGRSSKKTSDDDEYSKYLMANRVRSSVI